jgi:heme exporter protein D
VTPVVYVVAAVVMLPVVLLVVAAVRGRARVRSCCAADPAKDLRMRAAFTDE